MLNLLILPLSLSVLGDEDRDHREPLHDAPDREEHEVERIMVARDRDTQSRHPDREANDARVDIHIEPTNFAIRSAAFSLKPVRSLRFGGLGRAVTAVTRRLFGATVDFAVRVVISGGE